MVWLGTRNAESPAARRRSNGRRRRPVRSRNSSRAASWPEIRPRPRAGPHWLPAGDLDHRRKFAKRSPEQAGRAARGRRTTRSICARHVWSIYERLVTRPTSPRKSTDPAPTGIRRNTHADYVQRRSCACSDPRDAVTVMMTAANSVGSALNEDGRACNAPVWIERLPFVPHQDFVFPRAETRLTT
jgi:hypothetical protein